MATLALRTCKDSAYPAVRKTMWMRVKRTKAGAGGGVSCRWGSVGARVRVASTRHREMAASLFASTIWVFLGSLRCIHASLVVEFPVSCPFCHTFLIFSIRAFLRHLHALSSSSIAFAHAYNHFLYSSSLAGLHRTYRPSTFHIRVPSSIWHID